MQLTTKQRASKAMALHLPQQIASMHWRMNTMDIRSIEKTENLQGLGDFPAVEEYLKERNYQAVGQRDFIVKSRKWMLSTEIEVDELEREGGKWFISTRIPQIAKGFAAHPTRLFFELLENTVSTKTMTGKTFFNAAHPVIGSKTITNSNLVSGSGTSAAQVIADWFKVKRAFAAMKLRNGDRIFENIDTISYEIWIPNELDEVFTDVFNREPITGSATQGKLNNQNAKVKMFDRLNDANDWYVKITNMPMFQPFFFFKNYDPEFMWNDSKHLEFEKDVVRYGGKARYDIVYGYPEIIIKVVNA